jgi:hypothetical protein
MRSKRGYSGDDKNGAEEFIKGRPQSPEGNPFSLTFTVRKVLSILLDVGTSTSLRTCLDCLGIVV